MPRSLSFLLLALTLIVLASAQPAAPPLAPPQRLRALALPGIPDTEVAGQRPLLPQVQTYDTAHFRIHFTLRGVHAVPPADLNSDGVPDYVSFIGDVAEESWQGLVEEMAWPPPVVDDSAGGDDRTDIYLKDLGMTYLGYSDRDPRPCGDQPATPALEKAACSAFLILDNDIRRPGQEPQDLIRITVAHEFLHVLQFGIDSSEPGDWMWEAWAVWAEEILFDDINAYYLLLPPLFTAPDAPLDQHPYAAALLPLWLSEHVDPLAPRDVWLHAAEADGLDALSLGLEQHGVTPTDAFINYAAALLIRQPCPELAPYCWDEGIAYPPPAIEGELAPIWCGTVTRMATVAWRRSEQSSSDSTPTDLPICACAATPSTA